MSYKQKTNKKIQFNFYFENYHEREDLTFIPFHPNFFSESKRKTGTVFYDDKIDYIADNTMINIFIMMKVSLFI